MQMETVFIMEVLMLSNTVRFILIFILILDSTSNNFFPKQIRNLKGIGIGIGSGLDSDGAERKQRISIEENFIKENLCKNFIYNFKIKS